jgi:hypothetical protein
MVSFVEKCTTTTGTTAPHNGDPDVSWRKNARANTATEIDPDVSNAAAETRTYRRGGKYAFIVAPFDGLTLLIFIRRTLLSYPVYIRVSALRAFASDFHGLFSYVNPSSLPQSYIRVLMPFTSPFTLFCCVDTSGSPFCPAFHVSVMIIHPGDYT